MQEMLAPEEEEQSQEDAEEKGESIYYLTLSVFQMTEQICIYADLTGLVFLFLFFLHSAARKIILYCYL